MSMEELRSYYQIPGNINIELQDDPAESTIGEGEYRIFYSGIAHNRSSLPCFISNQAVPTLL